MPARPSALMTKVQSRADTMEKAKAHAKEARRQYRAALLEAFEGGVTVTDLARSRHTSWSRMGQLLDQAKAERGGLAVMN